MRLYLKQREATNISYGEIGNSYFVNDIMTTLKSIEETTDSQFQLLREDGMLNPIDNNSEKQTFSSSNEASCLSKGIESHFQCKWTPYSSSLQENKYLCNALCCAAAPRDGWQPYVIPSF
jgi:hypothetical protein